MEYDHYNYDKPVEKYQEAVQDVQKTCPQATFLRADIVERGEFTDYMTSKKGWCDSFNMRGVTNERYIKSK